MSEKQQLLHDYKQVEMSDHEFAQWLRERKWNGEYTTLANFNQFWVNENCIALVKCNNSTCQRWIYVKEN